MWQTDIQINRYNTDIEEDFQTGMTVTQGELHHCQFNHLEIRYMNENNHHT